MSIENWEFQVRHSDGEHRGIRYTVATVGAHDYCKVYVEGLDEEFDSEQEALDAIDKSKEAAK